MDYQKSSNKLWYIIGIIIILALVFWYFSSRSAPANPAPTAAVEQSQVQSPANTTADIIADLNQVPDNTTSLTQAEAASAQAVQGF